ncbi:hypothetical protein LVJ83_05070 [Uruburuella testudinis]|uniref:Uncharacterized protein n=1 Tax=Uruburuella testudinis TaxID=1282863 RepID=A0ABY4DUX2_9NEIS|nr:hypothetical protein [Uruburuella testudinis]UOO82833.1 hypothetical protein LVJ83_05070 [Uruburuella testudinis]
MWSDTSFWFVAVYIGVFVIAAYKAGEFQWLWGSILLWLGFGIAGARLLPGIWGITHWIPLYLPHFYITLASLFFFTNHWQKLPQGARHTGQGNVFLSLFAVSGLQMTLVFALLLLLVWYRFPAGITPYVLPALLQMYVFKPVYWMMAQAVMMGLFYLHRSHIMKEPANRFSRRQLQMGWLLALFFQAAWVVKALLEIRY